MTWTWGLVLQGLSQISNQVCHFPLSEGCGRLAGEHFSDKKPITMNRKKSLEFQTLRGLTKIAGILTNHTNHDRRNQMDILIGLAVVILMGLYIGFTMNMFDD